MKKNLHLTSLSLRIHSGESVIVSAFGDEAKDELESVANLGKLYTFLNLKVSPPPIFSIRIPLFKGGSEHGGG